VDKKAGTFLNSLPSIKSIPISSAIVDMITNAILNCRINPGDRLPTELELAQQLGVARNSVREAIKMLASIGAVEIKRGAGIFVPSKMNSSIINPLMLALVFEQGTSREFVELRIMFETGVAQLIAERRRSEDIEQLENANQRLLEEMNKQQPDGERLRSLDLGFHELMCKLTNNRLLIKMAQAVYKLFFASIEKTVMSDPSLAHHNHTLVIDAIKSGDSELVRHRIKESLNFWRDTVSQPREGGR
jgi:GntR family transcriptional repressor for pyruvate dehydrogenase complex